PPSFISREPFALLFRCIVTPNYEFECFLSSIKKTGLHPLFFEYERDYFVTCNRDKFRLARAMFTMSESVTRGMRIVYLAFLEGIPPIALCDLATRNGMKLAEFHHALLDAAYPGAKSHILD